MSLTSAYECISIANPVCLKFASIITLRIIMIITAQIMSKTGDYYSVQPCAKLLSILNNATELVERFPTCSALVLHSDTKAQAIVKADFADLPLGIMATLNESFGMAGWLALFLHAVGVEIYVGTLAFPHLSKLTLYSCILRHEKLSGCAKSAANDRWRLATRIPAIAA